MKQQQIKAPPRGGWELLVLSHLVASYPFQVPNESCKFSAAEIALDKFKTSCPILWADSHLMHQSGAAEVIVSWLLQRGRGHGWI